METYRIVTDDELYHYGVEGMHWGVRRYQNPDGSLTAAGKKRYYKELKKTVVKNERRRETAAARNVLDKNIGGDTSRNKRVSRELKQIRDAETREKNEDALYDATDPKKWVEKDKKKLATAVGVGAAGLAVKATAGKTLVASLLSNPVTAGMTVRAIGTAGMVTGAIASSPFMVPATAGSVAFVIGSTVASSIIDKYGDVDIRDLPAAIRANRRNRWR